MTSQPLRILIVEDRPEDVELVLHELKREGLCFEHRRVDDEKGFGAALDWAPQIILADYNLPQFTARRALELLRERGDDVPFIVITGSISEEVAVDMMKRGAADYLIKDRLTRLGVAVKQALEQKRLRDAQRANVDALRRMAEIERLLRLELDHRVRNNLASLLSLVDMTRRTTRDVGAFAESIGGRIRVMANVHGLLSAGRYSAMPVSRIVELVRPPGAERRVSVTGDDPLIPASQVASLAIVLHECFTNAQKHGALSAQDGRIDIACRFAEDDKGQAMLCLRWTERGGPAPSTPHEPGNGTQLIAGVVRSDLRGEIRFRWPPQGADHELSFPLAEESAAAPTASAAGE